MSKPYLIRYAATVQDPALPSRYWHLSEDARLVLDSLAKVLASYSVDVIAASIEKKAKETGCILSAVSLHEAKKLS